MKTIKCYECRDEGTKDGCPRCGVVYKDEINMDKVETSTFIPPFYKGKVWDKNTLIFSREDLYKGGANYKFKAYIEQMEKFHELFKNGLPRRSAIISGDVKTSKTTLMFSCIQFAMNYMDSIAKVMTTLEAKFLFSKGDTSELSKELLFIRVPATFDKFQSNDIIRELLVYRSMLGLPTFIICDFPIKSIMPTRYHSITDYTGKEDPLKYPALIECFKTEL